MLSICFQYADGINCNNIWPNGLEIDSIDKNGNSYSWIRRVFKDTIGCFKLYINGKSKKIKIHRFFSGSFEFLLQILEIRKGYNYKILSVIPSYFHNSGYFYGPYKIKVINLKNDTLKIKIPESRYNFNFFLMYMPRSLLYIPGIIAYQCRKIFNKDIRNRHIKTFVRYPEKLPLKKAIVLPSPYLKK